MITPAFVLAVFAAIGVFLLGLCAARLRLRRPVAATRSGAGGCACLAISALLVAIGINLYTYKRLTLEQPVATVSFRKLGEQRYAARLTPTGQPARRYDLAGDQWQLDARVLKWTGPATLLGLDADYRLERLTGRYVGAEGTARRLRSTHELAGNRGLDVWRIASSNPGWLPLVDAVYGSATYLPMADGARYTVSLNQTGLLARPANDAARRAVRDW